MANHVFPYGDPKKVHKTNEDFTPAQKQAKDKPDGAGVPTGQEVKEPKKEESDSEGVDKALWTEAERSVTNMGGLNGASPEGRKRLIRQHYDSLVENKHQTRAWAGDGAILGEK